MSTLLCGGWCSVTGPLGVKSLVIEARRLERRSPRGSELLKRSLTVRELDQVPQELRGPGWCNQHQDSHLGTFLPSPHPGPKCCGRPWALAEEGSVGRRPWWETQGWVYSVPGWEEQALGWPGQSRRKWRREEPRLQHLWSILWSCPRVLGFTYTLFLEEDNLHSREVPARVLIKRDPKCT